MISRSTMNVIHALCFVLKHIRPSIGLSASIRYIAIMKRAFIKPPSKPRGLRPTPRSCPGCSAATCPVRIPRYNPPARNSLCGAHSAA